MKSPSLQSQLVTCYQYDPNPGSTSSLHEPKHPHLGKESVPACTWLSLQGPLLIPSQPCVSVSKLSWQNLPLWEVLQEVKPQVFTDYLLAT